MRMIRLKKQDLGAAMARAAKAYAIAGPVPDRGSHIFRRLAQDECPDLSYTQSRLSPKSLLFPRAEPMFHFALPAGSEEEDQPRIFFEAESFKEAPLAVVGLRPYDARAFDILTLNFDCENYKDPFFLKRYDAMVRVGLADLIPDPANFSLAAGTGPFDETSLDILLADAGDAFIGRIITEKGEAFAKTAGFEPGGADTVGTLAAMRREAEALVDKSPVFDAILAAGALDLHASEFWEEAASSCINCSICTFACPTCWCFDMQDEVKEGRGVRLRLWDSCITDLHNAPGQSPSLEGYKRFRNRFMHKLKYFPDKHGIGIMCVGCGRCITQCPAGIDIRTVMAAMNQAAGRATSRAIGRESGRNKKAAAGTTTPVA